MNSLFYKKGLLLRNIFNIQKTIISYILLVLGGSDLKQRQPYPKYCLLTCSNFIIGTLRSRLV
jgi:hypothetical protein